MPAPTITDPLLRDAEIAKVPFLAALTGALRRYPSVMWPATLHSGRLALHPASTTIKRYLSYFRIPKADRLGLTSGHLASWVALFEHWQDETTMQTIDYPPVKQALNRLKSLSADAETRLQAMARERALFEEAMAISGAKAQGFEIGKAEGKAEFLTLLCTQRFGSLSHDITQRLESATQEQLRLWTERILR